MSKRVQLNYETWKEFSSDEIVTFNKMFYSHIVSIIKIEPGTYFVEYETEQSIDEIIGDIHVLANIMRQEAVAYIIEDTYNHICGLAGPHIETWKPFNMDLFHSYADFHGLEHISLYDRDFLV